MDKAITAIHWLTEMYVCVYDHVQRIDHMVDQRTFLCGQTKQQWNS